jgi:hypothetical protein
MWTAGGNVKRIAWRRERATLGGGDLRALVLLCRAPVYPGMADGGARRATHVDTSVSKNPITRLALVRAGSATHAFYPDQRYVGLSHVALESNDLYIGQVPASDIAISGYYLLFACTDKNVPSVGVFVQILT